MEPKLNMVVAVTRTSTFSVSHSLSLCQGITISALTCFHTLLHTFARICIKTQVPDIVLGQKRAAAVSARHRVVLRAHVPVSYTHLTLPTTPYV